MKPAGHQLGSAAVLVVVLAVFLPPAVAALKGLVVPLLVLAGIAIGLRLLWYWTSL